MDQFTLDIIQNGLEAISQEMFATMKRTSMSPIIYESLDYAVGITDEKGDLLAQGNGVTAFLACLDSVVASTLEKFSLQDFKEGDVVICNTPYAGGGTHLSDVSVVMPVFHEESIVAFTVNKAHWTELGGSFPGSVSTIAVEIYQEGLHFPFIKIKEGDKLNQAVIDIIKANVRLPDSTLGDLYAALASVERGARRVLELVSKYGASAFSTAKDYLQKYGEKMTLTALQAIPNGTYTGKSVLENDGFGNGPFPIKMKIMVSHDLFEVDLRGSHSQIRGAINLSYTGLVTGVRSVFKAITTPHIPVNGGAFKPLRVVVDKKSIVSAEDPSAFSIYYETLITCMDLMWKIMAPLMPEKLPSGHFRSVCATFISGVHPETGVFWIQAEPLAGGWGAGKDFDGNRGQLSCGSGESCNIPIEIREMRYGLMVDQYAFHNEGGGYGEYQGGNGQYLDFRITSEKAFLTAAYLGTVVPTWGINEGKDGSYNYVQVFRKNGEIEKYSMVTNIELNKDDVVRCITATGGGYGDPSKRPLEKVQMDVANGYITKEQAFEYYNICFTPQN
ncbi:MAG: hydantoinase B/oxoprolinase family protein [Bacteroidota bacterium]